MAVRVSTGYADQVLSGGAGFASVFLNGCIEVRSGLAPVNADAPATGTLLGRITRNGGAWTAGSPSNGLQWQTAGRFAVMNPAHSWSFVGIATGTAGWCRLVGNAADSGAYSTVLPRIDGNVGLIDIPADTQLFLTDLAIVAALEIEITSFWFAIPPI